jgi:hypothetical protein
MESRLTLLLCIFVDKTVVLQVAFNVAEARGANVIAVMVTTAMVIGAVVILILDFAAIKSSAKLLIRNVQQLIETL